MKTINKTKAFIWTCIFISISLSCSNDFLKINPNGALSSLTLANKKGAEALLIAAYSLVDEAAQDIPFVGVDGYVAEASNWVYGGIRGGDAHKGTDEGDQPDINAIERYEESPTNKYFNVKWGTLYEGIARANAAIRILPLVKDASQADLDRITAEAKALRGHFHFEAKIMWGNIPYVDEKAEDPGKVSNKTDAWPMIEKDLLDAYNTLSPLNSQVGRVNKYVAGAMLGKCYMFEKKYAEAKTVLTDIYSNGTNPLGVKFKLNAKFSDNFNAATKNSPESIWAAQTSVNDGANAWNGNFGDVLNFPYKSGASPAGCCGFYQPSFELVNSYRTIGGFPLLDGSYNNIANAMKNDYGIESSAPFTPDAGTIDPRLDWTVGRRGIPYLDWGIMTGKDWARKQTYGGPYAPIKNVYYKSQSGKYTDKSSWTEGWTANNVNLIRLSDVILMLAEIEVETGSLDAAADLVNLIRARAADPAGWVKDITGTAPAANYVINQYAHGQVGYFDSKVNARRTVHFERKLELGMEGHRWFDLVRWGEAVATITTYLAYESAILTQLAGASISDNETLFPIPQRQIDLSGASILVQNTGF